MTFMYASTYFNKVSFNLPSPLNSMVTMLLSETYYRECLTGYKTGLGYKTWSFPFPLMTSRRERGFLKHVKASPQEVEIKSSQQISLWLLQILLFFCFLVEIMWLHKPMRSQMLQRQKSTEVLQTIS